MPNLAATKYAKHGNDKYRKNNRTHRRLNAIRVESENTARKYDETSLTKKAFSAEFELLISADSELCFNTYSQNFGSWGVPTFVSPEGFNIFARWSMMGNHCFSYLVWLG